MIRGAIGLDDVFDSLAPICDISKPLVFSRANTVLPFLTVGLENSIGYSRSFSAIYTRNCRALSKNLIRFEGFLDSVVRFLDSFRTFGVEGKERIRRFFGNNTAVVLLGLAQDPDLYTTEGTNPLISSSRASSSPACTSVTSTFFLHAFLPLREGCLYC